MVGDGKFKIKKKIGKQYQYIESFSSMLCSLYSHLLRKLCQKNKDNTCIHKSQIHNIKIYIVWQHAYIYEAT